MLPVLLVLLAVELFYRFAPNTYTEKKKILEQNENAEIMILGNSHTYYGLNPDFFDPETINAANISQSLYFDRLVFDKFRDKYKNLNTIILCVDYFTLSKTDDTGEDAWRKFYYEKYMDIDVPVVSGLELGNYFLSSTRNTSINIELIKKYFKNGTLADCDKNGFGNSYTKEKRLSGFSKLAPVIVKKHEDGSLDFSQNQLRIQELAALCESLGIKIILITMPVSKGYAQNVNGAKLRKITETCKALHIQNKNVYYLNLFQDSRFSDDDFYDVDHLHNQGAEKCSKIVNDYLKSID